MMKNVIKRNHGDGMKVLIQLFLVALAAPLLVAQSGSVPDDKRLQEIRAKKQRGEVLTLEERDYGESTIEFQNQSNSAKRFADWAREHPARESTGLVPLPDLGKGMYKGEQGGLYPDGENTPPPAHLKAGMALAKAIVPLDANGQPSATGKIVLITIGMSNTTQESRSFILMVRKSHRNELNPQVALIDGAEGAQTASIIARPEAKYWQMPVSRLKDEGYTPAQVQVAWLKEANAMPKDPFPAEPKKMQAEMAQVVRNLHDKFPNLKMVYISPRTYGGNAGGPLNPEPHAYETGFAAKWLIAGQIAGNPELNYDPAKGAVRAPWLAWGPYIWTDGTRGRKDGWTWSREDNGPDGTHPSRQGREKVAELLLAFFEKDPTTQPWFCKH
jgi:hypothetical protein